MHKKLKVAIISETKSPPDRRVALPPELAKEFVKLFPEVELAIQTSSIRAFPDKEYIEAGINVQDDISEYDILIGIKEVAIPELISGKTYMFFSHTAKQQPYNRKLLQEIIKKKITLIDYEYLTNQNNIRQIAFGYWAGIVGTYNGLMTYGLRKNLYKLKRSYQCFDIKEFNNELKKVKLPNIKIVITGGGRVAGGALEILSRINIRKISSADFLNNTYNEPVYTQIEPKNYVKHKQEKEFNFKHFVNHPNEYESTFLPYAKEADIFISCHFWDKKSPILLSKSDLKNENIKIKVIADVTCDINGSIASTIRSSSISEPVYGYNPKNQNEGKAYATENITIMAVDNLPGELPRDASLFFGKTLISKILPALVGNDSEGVIERATITKNGKLTPKFSYLSDFINAEFKS